MRSTLRLNTSQPRYAVIDYILPPIVAFIIVGIVNFLIIRVNAFWGSVVLSFPVMEFALFVTLAILYNPLSESNKKAIGGTCGTAAIGMIITIGWLLVMYYLLYIRNDVSIWHALTWSTLVWIVLLIVYMIVMCGSPIAIKNCIPVGGQTHIDVS